MGILCYVDIIQCGDRLLVIQCLVSASNTYINEIINNLGIKQLKSCLKQTREHKQKKLMQIFKSTLPHWDPTHQL